MQGWTQQVVAAAWYRRSIPGGCVYVKAAAASVARTRKRSRFHPALARERRQQGSQPARQPGRQAAGEGCRPGRGCSLSLLHTRVLQNMPAKPLLPPAGMCQLPMVQFRVYLPHKDGQSAPTALYCLLCGCAASDICCVIELHRWLKITPIFGDILFF